MLIKKALVVDDSSIARKMMIRSILTHRTVDICEAVDGADAVAKFKEFEPDVIFMDLTMPNMDGVQAQREIRKINKDIIIVICSADIQGKMREMVTEDGAFAIVKKPVDKDELENVILRLETL